MTNKKEILKDLNSQIEEANQSFDLKEYFRLTKEYNKIKEEIEDQNLNLENIERLNMLTDFIDYTQESLEEDYLEVIDEYKDLYLQYQFERMNY